MTGLFRKCGCYIVVGGLTGLGRVLVKYIAESGAGHIAIFSRRQPSDEQKQYFKDLETGCSCTIHTLQVDVTDLESLYLARQSVCFALNGVPIRGIFQGAGVLVDAIYENQTEETLVKVLKPKLDGTWNLHVSFKDLPLDYFVMHSSVTSLLGNPGQTNYAAANSFLDIYQLLLAVETGQPTATILTDIDLRAEIPAIANEVVRGINVIPLSAQPSNDMTFSEFLEENKKQMIADIEHGQLPYIDIVNFLQPENKASFGRHYLIMNDMTKLDMLASGTPDHPYTVSIKNIWLAKLSKETICQVVYNKTKQSITIHFHYNERLCGVERGRHFGEKLFQILHHGIRNRHQTIGTVFHKTDCFHGPKQMKQPDIANESHSSPAEKIQLSSPSKYRPRTHLNVQPMEIINGYFQKQTKAGWSHRVYVTLLEHQDNDNDAKWITIQWSKKPGRPTKSLSVSTCDSISMLNLNRQHSIVVQARERQLVICTPEHEVAQRWMTVLENSAKRPTRL
ncbi:APMLA-like protein [Mya arenaria]|uniref:APMLA-like protein n=1 Tax=Mya arenaria TaxID=6604 RepID=A0ABY7DLL5_MYAAR|nr:APMLA-like protein [Mya arenaria]